MVKSVRRGIYHHYHSGTAGTTKLLVTPSRRTHDANFRRILPSAMKKMMEEGLFEPDGEGSYRITQKGLQKLVELEQEEGK